MNRARKTAIAIVFLAFGLLAGCTQPSPRPRPADINLALREAQTPADHEAVAARYEQAARDAEAKAAEQQKMLDKYKEHSYLYGKQAAMLEEHCDALINHYQRVAKSNWQLAKLHRQIAEGSK